MAEERFCLNVPLNEAGRVEHDGGGDYMPNVFNICLDHSECCALYPVYFEWNKRFGILIDMYEEEEIQREHLDDALRILDQFVNESQSSAFIEAAKKLRVALRKALEVNMPLHLDF